MVFLRQINLPPKPLEEMIRKHQTTAEMVKKLLNVIETRVERANAKASKDSTRLEASWDRSTI